MFKSIVKYATGGVKYGLSMGNVTYGLSTGGVKYGLLMSNVKYCNLLLRNNFMIFDRKYSIKTTAIKPIIEEVTAKQTIKEEEHNPETVKNLIGLIGYFLVGFVLIEMFPIIAIFHIILFITIIFTIIGILSTLLNIYNTIINKYKNQ